MTRKGQCEKEGLEQILQEVRESHVDLRWGVLNNRKGRGKGPEAVGCQRVWEKPEQLK